LFVIACSCILYGFLHFWHSFLRSLCDITNFSADAIRNGSIPILIRRCIVAEAEFVCIVDNTKCHVRAASIASIAVSLSRISHTIIISGS